jgi:hypothetical protein
MNKEMKTNLTSVIFAIGCLILYFLFPIEELKFEIVIGAISFLVILPILYTKLVLKGNYEDVGFTTFRLSMRDIFFILSTIVIGGLLSFVVVSTGWGVDAYIAILSKVILIHFGAFILYEIIFAASILFLFTFFAWGFVYSIKCQKKSMSFSLAFLTYILLLMSFYNNLWIIIPLCIPVFFVRQIRDKKNILYMFLSIFVIALILDTLLVKSFQ